MGIRGHVDSLTATAVRGWAFEETNPAMPLDIEVVVGDRIVASGKADGFRPDLAAAKLGARCAFDLNFDPLTEEELLAAEVKPVGAGLVFGRPKGDLLQTVVRSALARYPGAVHYTSLFGGLWTDRSDAEEMVRGMRELDQISQEMAVLLVDWTRNGFVVLRGAVAPEILDRVAEDANRARRGDLPRVVVQPLDRHPYDALGVTEATKVRILDPHMASEAIRDAIYAPALMGFLAVLFNRPPLAFDQALESTDSGQGLHQDSTVVAVSSPLEMVTSWIPLGDAKPGESDLELYAGSHKLPEFLFDGKHKWMPQESTERDAYYRSLHEQAARLGLTRRRLSLGRGDAVLLAADLAYSIGAESENGVRDALLTRYCPHNVKPMYSYWTGVSGYLRHASGGYCCAQTRMP